MNQLKFSAIIANEGTKLFPVGIELDPNTVTGFDNGIYPKIFPIEGIGQAIFREGVTTVEHRTASEESQACTVVQGGELMGQEIPTEVELIISAKPSGMSFLERSMSKARGRVAQPVYRATANLISHPVQ